MRVAVPVVEKWAANCRSFLAMVGEEFLHQRDDFLLEEVFKGWRVFLVDDEPNAAWAESRRSDRFPGRREECERLRGVALGRSRGRESASKTLVGGGRRKLVRGQGFADPEERGWI